MVIVMGRLDGKVAVVTGASTGLGRSTAMLYAQEGAKVVVADVRRDEANEVVEQIRGDGGQAIFVPVDVSSATEVQQMIATTQREFGAIHIMTANAGIQGRGSGKRLEELTTPEIEEIMAVNFYGVVHCLQHAVPAIRAAGGGAISVTTSVAAHYGYPVTPVYAASKHAVVGLVKSLSADVGPLIRVNAVSAGRMITQIETHTLEAKGIDPSEDGPHREYMTLGTEENQYTVNPRQVAYMHLFLVSDEASFVNGQAIIVDGGRTAVPASG